MLLRNNSNPGKGHNTAGLEHDHRDDAAAGHYSRSMNNRVDWMYSKENVKADVLLSARPRSAIYVRNRNKDRWSRPFDRYGSLPASRVRANRMAVEKRSKLLSRGLKIPSPYITNTAAVQSEEKSSLHLLHNGGSKVVSSTAASANESTRNSVPDSTYNAARAGSLEWRNTEVVTNGGKVVALP